MKAQDQDWETVAFLAIARWAVHLNEGWIDLESEPGTGSAFRIVLPLATDAGPAHEEVNGG